MTESLKQNDRLLLQRVAHGPISFTHAIDMRGTGTKLVRSTVSPSQQKHARRLALDGLLAHNVTGCGGHGQPPESTVTYTLTAKGREALGLHRQEPIPVHRGQPLTDDELAAEGIE